MKKGPTPPRRWMPLLPGERVEKSPEETAALREALHERIRDAAPDEYDPDRINSIIDSEMNPEMWMNDLYTVIVKRDPDGTVFHLSIRRNDRKAARDWRDFQRIKNQLAGPEVEAVELYPAESRLLDTANQFHLWCLPPGKQFPVGYHLGSRTVHDASDGVQIPGSVQRPLEDS